MSNKYLEIIKNGEERKVFTDILKHLDKFNRGMSSIQVNNFVLNDVEFPTDYGKFQQAGFEIFNRYNRVVDFYFQLKELEIKIKIKEEEIQKEENKLKKELLVLQKEKLEIKKLNIEGELKKIVREALIFKSVLDKYPEFFKLNPQKEFELEVENWAKKTINMPNVFEERYGENYMKKALGEVNYQKYKELRQRGFGFLPREIFDIKQLK